jgi:formylglycine-generating enzyme required for sulfatase activity
VRVQDYRAYAEAASGVDVHWMNPYFSQGDTHPVVNVAWEDAKAFCDWLSRKEGQTYRLPTDAEWSVAVGLPHEAGNTPKDKDMKTKNVYPWGRQWPPPKGAGNYDPRLQVDDFQHTSPVGSFEANPFGLYDMGGNVWEHCKDYYEPDSGRVLRGGSWHDDDPDDLLSSRRSLSAPLFRLDGNGFRCVLVGRSSP